ncbi:MAG: hypothetical protein EXS16_09925 [Gemmataceae bacterium]|nr:hypothetical protein [Gemmataceae bacterium]
MEVLAGLFCFLLALAAVITVVAGVGHGIWLMFASIFASPKPAAEQPRQSRRSVSCIGCKELFQPDDSDDCPHCGLNPEGVVASELKDIDAAQRVLRDLIQNKRLTSAVGEESLQALTARIAFLLGKPDPSPKVGVLVSPIKSVPLPPLAQLEAWFARDLGRALSTDDKKKALALARGLLDEELRHLSPRALVGVARLQAAVGMTSRACRAYQVVLEHPTDLNLLAEIAVEALETASKLPTSESLDAMVLRLSAYPAIVASQPALAKWFPRHVAEPTPVSIAPTLVAVTIAAQKAESIPEPVAPVARRRSFAEWFGVFMEERNILWGELIGGTLVVGCSIALVISFWQKLEQIPFSPFFIIAAITCSLFGAGLYTLHHWKLESTSRGLLLIAMLLTPLNFLVLAGLTREEGAGWVGYAMAAGALVVLGGFLHRAGRILVRDPLALSLPSAEIMTASVLVSSMAQLTAPIAMARTGGVGVDYAISLIPVLAMVLAVGWLLVPLARLETWSVARIAAVLIAAGAMMFASGVAVASTLFGDRDLAQVLLHFSPALALFGVPILTIGVLLNRKLPIGDSTAADAGPSAMWRVLGTSLALAGQFVLFGAFIVSVSDPLHRWAVGLFNLVVLTTTAWLLRSSILFVPVQLYLATLIVMGWAFDIDAMVRQPLAALRLTGLLVVQAIAAEAMMRCRRVRDAYCWSIGAAVSTGLAGLLILPYAQDHPLATAMTLAAVSVIWLTANLRHRFAEITYACTLAFAAAICIGTQHWFHDTSLAHRVIWGLLGHASVFLVLSLALRFVPRLRAIAWLQDMYRVPMQFSAVASSVVAAVVVGFEASHFGLAWSWSGAACCWLAVLWLTLAIVECWPILFACSQFVVATALVLISGDMLMERGFDWREPYCLSVYALGIAGLSLGWEMIRLSMGKSQSIAMVLTLKFVPIDRILAGMMLIGQYLLVALVILWGIGQEISITPDAWRAFTIEWHDHGLSWIGWALVIVLATIVAIWAKDGHVKLAAPAMAILILTVPMLAAGMFFADQRAMASATRWGLTLAFAGGSAVLWWRHRLLGDIEARLPIVWVRGILLAGAVVPTLVLSGYVVASRLNHIAIPGPLDGVFRAMGRPLSLLAPLAVTSIVLAGHGFRERLAYYLSSAGVLNVACAIGGFLLTLPRADLGESWIAPASLLIGSATAWIWTFLWVAIAGRIHRETDRPLLESPLLLLNNVAGVALYLVALVPAVIQILFSVDDALKPWIDLGGSIWSWAAFVLMIGGYGLYARQRHASVSLHVIGSLGMIALGVVACSIERGLVGQGFAGLMLASGIFCCGWVALHVSFDGLNPPRWLRVSGELSEATVYTIASGLLAATMSLSTLWHDEQPYHAAITASLTATAGLLLARHRRAERYAVGATFLLMLAGTILAIHLGENQRPFWLWIIHVNFAVLGVVSLVRLALHPWLAGVDVELGSFRCLPVQIAIGISIQGLMLINGLLNWAWVPNQQSPYLQDLASAIGWIAFALNAIAATWYYIVVRGWSIEDIISLCGLMAGVLLAGTADGISDASWAAFHALAGVWLASAFGIVGVSWMSQVRQSQGLVAIERGPWWSDLFWRGFPAGPTRGWASLLSVFVTLITLWIAWTQDGQLVWPVGYLGAVAVLFALQAIWAQATRYQYLSGLMLQLVGLTLAIAWSVGPEWSDAERFNMIVLTQALCAACAGIVWSLIERVTTRKGEAFTDDLGFAFSQAAISAGIFSLFALTAYASISHWNRDPLPFSMPLACIALASLAFGACVELWREADRQFARGQLYVCGLTALGLVLYSLNLQPADWLWYATVLGSSYVLAVCVSMYIMEETAFVRGLLHFEPHRASHGRWLWYIQMSAMAILLALSLWITLDFDTRTARLGGSAACALLTASAFVMTCVWPRIRRADLLLDDRRLAFQVVLSVGLLSLLEASLAVFDLPPIWLHRSGAVLPVLTLCCVALRYSLPIIVRDADWRAAGRSFSAVLAVVSVVAMALLIGQELVHFDGREGIKVCPLHKGLAVLAGLGFAGVIALTLHSVLTKEADAYGIEGEHRSAYVYIAEALILMLAIHARLNVPNLFHPVLGQYWFFVVMALALAMTTTSDLFTQKGLTILAVPIRRSAFGLAFVPVLAFRLAPICTGMLHQMREAVPGLEPFLDYLVRFSQGYHWEAVCWMLLGVFLGWQAQRRASGNFGIAAALAINFGVWVLLGNQDATTFLQRPQLWLIPLGLIVLVAEYVNRERVGFWHSLSLRYVGLTLIYLSSTIEMFKEGLSQPWFAIILALIAVAGMLLGILFRVRAFMLTGFMALLVVVFAQIWHAAVDKQQTWIWWASGLILGVLILILFALFEKKRNEVLHVIDNMKRWD